MHVISKIRGHEEKFKVITRDGFEGFVTRNLATGYAIAKSIQNKNISQIGIVDELLVFRYKDKEIKLDLGGASDPYAPFFYEEYSFLKVKHKTVIDIGANIGDSSIYFALNGAKKVVGIEPYPYAYRLMEKNIRLNSLQKTVIPLNAGYGPIGSVVVTTKNSSNGMDLKEAKKGKTIPLYNLAYLSKRFKLNHAILKMDCEGCEYNLLKEEKAVIRKFDQIQIEYHYGCEELVKKLRQAGFKVSHTTPKSIYNQDASNPKMSIGYIYALRKQA